METNDSDLWERYMGRDVSPDQYAEAGPVTLERLRADLRELWASHVHDGLTEAEIDDIARRILRLFGERG